MRASPSLRRSSCLLSGICAAGVTVALVVAAPTGAAPRIAPCASRALTGKVHSSQGAAGTIYLSIAFRNVSRTACTLRGFPRLALRGVRGALPTRVVHGGYPLFNVRPKLVRLAPRGYATLRIAYSDVPTGNETRCPMGTAIVVGISGGGTIPVRAVTYACGRGLLRESPFVAGLRQA